MTTTRSDNPPILVERDGVWWIEIMLAGGQDVVQAPVGDAAWLYQQIVEKLVLPRLRQPLWRSSEQVDEELHAKMDDLRRRARDELAAQAQELDMGYGSPND